MSKMIIDKCDIYDYVNTGEELKTNLYFISNMKHMKERLLYGPSDNNTWYIYDYNTETVFVIEPDEYVTLEEEPVVWKVSSYGDVEKTMETAYDLETDLAIDDVVSITESAMLKETYEGGEYGDLCRVTDWHLIDDEGYKEVKGIKSEYNSESKFYKRFYSKLSPELQEEFDMLMSAFMAYKDEIDYNMPEHSEQIEHAIDEVLRRYNDKIDDIEEK